MQERWGPSRDLDFWTARARGLVPPEERRAVALLASVTDERRFSAYCATGRMAALGDVTKRIYIVQRFGKVVELDDGRPSVLWCIGTPDRGTTPPTDHVVTMKNLIEGEEGAFRATGNPSSASFYPSHGSLGDGGAPYEAPFLPEYAKPPKARSSGIFGEDLADFMAVKRERDRLAWKLSFTKKALESAVRFEAGLRTPEHRREREAELRRRIGDAGFTEPKENLVDVPLFGRQFGVPIMSAAGTSRILAGVGLTNATLNITNESGQEAGGFYVTTAAGMDACAVQTPL